MRPWSLYGVHLGSCSTIRGRRSDVGPRTARSIRCESTQDCLICTRRFARTSQLRRSLVSAELMSYTKQLLTYFSYRATQIIIWFYAMTGGRLRIYIKHDKLLTNCYPSTPQNHSSSRRWSIFLAVKTLRSLIFGHYPLSNLYVHTWLGLYERRFAADKPDSLSLHELVLLSSRQPLHNTFKWQIHAVQNDHLHGRNSGCAWCLDRSAHIQYLATLALLEWHLSLIVRATLTNVISTGVLELRLTFGPCPNYSLSSYLCTHSLLSLFWPFWRSLKSCCSW